jgi:hypothetical protein
MKKKSTSQFGFLNLRVLIGTFVFLAGLCLALAGASLYPASSRAQPDSQAQTQTGSGMPGAVNASGPTVVRMIGPVAQNQDLRSLPHIPQSPETEERRLTRYPHPELGGPPISQLSRFAQIQSWINGLLQPIPTIPSPLMTFDGMNSSGPNGTNCGCLPPDSDGDVGPNHYIEALNFAFRVFDKNGNPLAPVTTFNSFFAPLPNNTPCGNNQNSGDPFVFYDHLADRWVVSDMAFPSFPGDSFWECIGVSQTGDPVNGSWFLYAVQIDQAHPQQLGDYPKFALWNNPQPGGAYIFTVNLFTNSFTFNGVRVFALDRASMIAGVGTGGPPNAIAFTIPPAGVGDAYSLVPAGFRTANPPPAGRDAFLLAIDSPLSGGVVLSQVHGWKFHVDFATPANSTLGIGPNHTPDSNIAVAPFVDAFTNTTTLLVPQFRTSQRLDTVGDRLMTPVVYQNRSGTESLWASHTVCTDLNCTSPTAVRWYQFTLPGGNFTATIAQQQNWTNGNDGLWRWMPSIAVDGAGNAAIGYSTSSTTIFPSIRYAGRLAGDPPNNLGQGEAVIRNGGGSQLDSSGRWGDYSMTTIDPADGVTFWHVNEYYYYPISGQASWFTRIGKFNFAGAPPGERPTPTPRPYPTPAPRP